MDLNLLQLNSSTLTREFLWLAQCIDERFKAYFQAESQIPAEFAFDAPPNLATDTSTYAAYLKRFELKNEERLIILLALAPHLKPQLLDVFFTKNSGLDRSFTEFGGIRGQNHAGFIPTLETACFLIAGSDLEKRILVLRMLSDSEVLRTLNIIQSASPMHQDPMQSVPLQISNESLSLFTWGESKRPDYNTQFPAQYISTLADWNDLVLHSTTLSEIDQIRDWLKHGHSILEISGLKKHIKPGVRALFYGPPGTGKTMTAILLGKELNLDVYRIDISMLVSKFIGETEKNLAQVFDLAMHKNWILFFDEADALFGKRSSTNSSNDRYANMEVAYLLQRIEEFPGTIILSSNLKSNMDDAFARRFHSMVHFPLPDTILRLAIWKNLFSNHWELEDKIDLEELSRKYELSGGAITNVLRYCAIQAQKRTSNLILWADILTGIRREFSKEGKTTY
ncbi:MAG: ATP-binding protein [Flavobacteriales bacterium]